MASVDELVAALGAVLAPRDEILEAYLFGSQARGDARPDSDVDVAVFVSPERLPDLERESAFGYDAALLTDLMSALRSNRVDLVLLNRADTVLYHRVLRDGIRFLSRDLRASTTREGYALSRYFDHVPHLRRVQAAQSARIRRGEFGK